MAQTTEFSNSILRAVNIIKNAFAKANKKNINLIIILNYDMHFNVYALQDYEFEVELLNLLEDCNIDRSFFKDGKALLETYGLRAFYREPSSDSCVMVDREHLLILKNF